MIRGAYSPNPKKPPFDGALESLQSIRSINGVARLTDRRESGRGGVRSWMQVQRVPVVSTRIAGLVGLFHSPSKLGTSNSIPTNSSEASLLIGCC